MLTLSPRRVRSLTTLGDDLTTPSADGQDLATEINALTNSAVDTYTKILQAQTQAKLAQQGYLPVSSIGASPAVYSPYNSNWIVWVLLLGGAYLIFKDR